MKNLIILLIVLFSCTSPKNEGKWHLRHYSVVEANKTNVKQLSQYPFSTWEMNDNILIIDGIKKTFKTNGYKIQVFGNDLESEYSIKSWNSDELLLSQITYEGNEYLFLFKR